MFAFMQVPQLSQIGHHQPCTCCRFVFCFSGVWQAWPVQANMALRHARELEVLWSFAGRGTVGQLHCSQPCAQGTAISCISLVADCDVITLIILPDMPGIPWLLLPRHAAAASCLDCFCDTRAVRATALASDSLLGHCLRISRPRRSPLRCSSAPRAFPGLAAGRAPAPPR